jgi:hypothetical protein
VIAGVVPAFIISEKDKLDYKPQKTDFSDFMRRFQKHIEESMTFNLFFWT